MNFNTYILYFLIYTIRNENIVKTRFKSKNEWLAYMKKLKIFGAPRRTPPSSPEPVRYMDCLIRF